MPSTNALTIPAPHSAPVPVLVPRGSPRVAALPSLTRRAGPSLGSGAILALILLALLLQASFFVGLASGRPAGPAPVAGAQGAVAGR